MARRNPTWAQDELILALDLYFRVNPNHIPKEHPDVVELSKILNTLPIHTDRPDEARFRNPNGVYMKLCNFLRFDPDYTGTGLQRGGKEERAVWDEFHNDRERLAKVAQSIRALSASRTRRDLSTPVEDEENAAPEGRLLYRLHRTRERSRALVRKKKAAALRKHGRLACTVCGFDFAERYGPLGEGFIECL